MTAPEKVRVERKVGDVWDQDIQELLDEWRSGDSARPGEWKWVLDAKRGDHHYPEVLESIRKHGFIRPLTCYAKEGCACTDCLTSVRPHVYFADGHHRLAAAIDLGMTTVPLEYKPDYESSYRCTKQERTTPTKEWLH